MHAATPVCKILHAKPRHDQDYKWPKLSEAYRYFFGRALEGAHDALVDVKACRDVYFEMKRLGVV
jgi:DNA polymerase III epsilon subunit-like protein